MALIVPGLLAQNTQRLKKNQTFLKSLKPYPEKNSLSLGFVSDESGVCALTYTCARAPSVSPVHAINLRAQTARAFTRKK